MMMEAVRTSETSVYSETTRHYIPEGSHLHTRSRESLKCPKLQTETEAVMAVHLKPVAGMRRGVNVRLL